MPTEAGKKAARVAAQREVARTGSDGVDLARRAEVHEQTVQAFLNGRRWPSLKTLGKLDAALGWPVGTLSAIAEEVEADPGADTVSAHSDTGDALLIARPDGLSDDEWHRIKDDAQGYIQWQLSKARPTTP